MLKTICSHFWPISLQYSFRPHCFLLRRHRLFLRHHQHYRVWIRFFFQPFLICSFHSDSFILIWHAKCARWKILSLINPLQARFIVSQMRKLRKKQLLETRAQEKMKCGAERSVGVVRTCKGKLKPMRGKMCEKNGVNANTTLSTNNQHGNKLNK